MKIANMIFAGIQEKGYSEKISRELDGQIKEMMQEYCDLEDVKISYDDLDELLHDVASIGQYEGFKLGLKAMLEFMKEMEKE